MHSLVIGFPDSILNHFQNLSSSLADRSALLQKAIAQSQSVQESLDSLLQSIGKVEKKLEEEQVTSLSSGVIQEALANNMVRPLPQELAQDGMFTVYNYGIISHNYTILKVSQGKNSLP